MSSYSLWLAMIDLEMMCPRGGIVVFDGIALMHGLMIRPPKIEERVHLAEIPADLVEARNLMHGQRPGWAVAITSVRDLFVKSETLMERIAIDEDLFALIDAHGAFRLEAEARGQPVPRDWHTRLDELLTEGGR